MHRSGDAINRNPTIPVDFIHEDQVNIISKIVLIGKRLIKTGNVRKPVKRLGKQ